MKNYMAQLERLGYVPPRDLSVGLIMNGLTGDFAGFIRTYNMHNIGKTIRELHALLIEYEKSLPKKADTPQVIAIQGGRIQKANKKSQKTKGKGKGKGKGKDKSYISKPKNPKPSAKQYLVKNDAYHHCKEVGHCKMNCSAYLAELIKKKKQVGTASSSDFLVWGCKALVKRDTPDKLQQRYVKCIFIGYPTEMMGYYFYFPPKNKIVVERYAEFLEKYFIYQEVSGRAVELEEIQESVRKHRAHECLCLNVEAKEHSLGDLNKHANYKDALLDLKSDKWLDVMNAKMQSMKDIQVWCFVDLPPNEPHWTAVKIILKYLSNTKDMFLVNGRNLEAEHRVGCYWNAGFETDRDEIKSHTRCVFILNGRHSEINLLKVHTDDNLVDTFTKALPKGKHTQYARSMGLRLASSFM
ncbi:hypothetical protein Tco_0543586 [Tanacetum coccineum]